MNKKIRIIFLIVIIFLFLLVYFFIKSKGRAVVSDTAPLSTTHSQKNVAETPLPSHDMISSSSDDTIKKDSIKPNAPSTRVLVILNGKVTDESGHPLPNAKISIFSRTVFWGIPVRLKDQLTDSKGCYRFSDLPVESLGITAELPGYFLEINKVDFKHDILSARKDFILKKGGLPLAGVVRNEKGELVEGARLLLSLPESHFFIEEYSTKDGSFRFDGLWNAIADLSAISQGYMLWKSPSVPVGSGKLDVVLKKGGTRLKGNVTWESSEKPIENVFVKISEIYTQTDETGYYETVFFPPGSYDIYVIHKLMGSGTVPFQKVEIQKNAVDEIRLDLTLYELCDIRGTVSDDEDDKPIQGALVWCGISSRIENIFRVYCSESHFVRTDFQGMFRLDECSTRLNTGEFIDINVFTKGYPFQTSHIYKSNWNNPPLWDIRLNKGISITGIVYDSDKIPVPEALLIFCDNDERWKKDNVFTDENGFFSMCYSHSKKGTDIFITAYDPEHGYALDRLTLSVETDDMIHDIHLSPGLDFNVKVVDENDRGMKDFAIYAKTAYKEVPAFDRVLYTDFDGAVLFRNLPPLSLEFGAVNYPRNIKHLKRLDLANLSEPQELIFKTNEREFSIFGFVTDTQGNPLKDVNVQSFGAGKILTDEKGYYSVELNNLNSNEQEKQVWIFFSLEDYVTKRENVMLQEKRIPLNVTLQNKRQDGLMLYGKVKASDGTIPPNVYLWLILDKRRGIGYSSHIALSKKGNFEIDITSSYYYHKGDGFRIMAWHPTLGSGLSREIIAMDKGYQGPFEITLQRGILKGYVRHADTGSPIQNAILSLLDTSENHLRSKKIPFAKTDESGYFKLDPLPFGKNTIHVSHREYESKELELAVISETKPVKDWNVFLEPRSTINGCILDSLGNPLPNISVKSGPHYDKTNANGRFMIKGLMGGDRNLEITLYPDKKLSQATIIYQKKIILSRKENKSIEIRLPLLTPVHVVVKDKTRFHLKALSPMDIDLFYISCEFYLLEKGLSIPLPEGTFLVQSEDGKISDREVTFLPGTANELIIPGKSEEK